MREQVPEHDSGPNLLAQMRYEQRDANINKTMISIVIFIGFFVFSMVITLGIYAYFIPDWGKLGQIAKPLEYRPIPPHPQLQVEPKVEMAAYRMAEDKLVRGEQGSVPGTKPAMTIEAAIENIATERGISGVKGTALKERGNAYPGSGMYAGMEAHGESHSGESHSGESGHAEGDHAEGNHAESEHGSGEHSGGH
jgi:hypothetical protein